MITMSQSAVDPADAIARIISERDIKRVLHFTTNQGLLGVLASRELMSRTHLKADDYLENIGILNSKIRREASQYWAYVNLSITDINKRFFDIASNKWWKDQDLFWVTIELTPTVLTHDGVLFSTTNMGYTGVVPKVGPEGLEDIFADSVHAGFGNFQRRASHQTVDEPTNSQAEALYPGAISTEHVTAVYAYTDEHAAIAEAMCAAVGHEPLAIVVAPDVFQL